MRQISFRWNVQAAWGISMPADEKSQHKVISDERKHRPKQRASELQQGSDRKSEQGQRTGRAKRLVHGLREMGMAIECSHPSHWPRRANDRQPRRSGRIPQAPEAVWCPALAMFKEHAPLITE